jgi:hypothetical protein
MTVTRAARIAAWRWVSGFIVSIRPSASPPAGALPGAKLGLGGINR